MYAIWCALQIEKYVNAEPLPEPRPGISFCQTSSTRDVLVGVLRGGQRWAAPMHVYPACLLFLCIALSPQALLGRPIMWL
jgi:hypothetical protein